MTDTMRYRHGDTRPITLAVESASVIEIGDLVYLNTDDALPASSQADQGSETANQRLFAANFLGVAEQRSRSGDDAPIRIATSGVFEFQCDSATFEVGDLVGVDEAASGTALEDQKVVAVASEDLAIGKVAQTVSAAATTVKVTIGSKTMQLSGLGGSTQYLPDVAQQNLSTTGSSDAANVTSYYTAITSNGLHTVTLADGTHTGQLKLVRLVVDGGTVTFTPATFADGTSITFADAGDEVLLRWGASGWRALRLGNAADGTSAPAIVA
jgi:hypothetical protein